MATLTEILSDIDFQDDLIDPLIDNGWYDFVFPFLMIYAILITVLTHVPMFRDRKGIRVVISLVFSLFAVAFPITDNNCSSASGISISDGCTIGDFLIVLFPGVTAFSIVILALYIVAAMMGLNLMSFFDNESENKWIKYALGIIALLVVGFFTAKALGYDVDNDDTGIVEFLKDPLLWILIVFIAVFWFITRDEPSEIDKYDKKYKKLRKSGLDHAETENHLGPRPPREDQTPP